MKQFNILLNCIKEKRVNYFKQAVEINYNWLMFFKFVNTHPNKHFTTQFKHDFFILDQIQLRESLPIFSKQLINLLKKETYKNTITNQAYCSFENINGSFGIHKDKMDVLYLQVLGNVEWSIFDNNNLKLQSEILTPGDLVYVPRHIYHSSNPLGPRVGFSHGIEGIDPSTYM